MSEMFGHALAVLLAGFVASTAAGTPCPEVTAEPVEGGSLIRVRHNQKQSLTAFVVEIVGYPGNHFAYMEDDLFRGSIAAGKEKRVVVMTLMPGTVPDYLKTTAAIYEDGATCGAAGKVKTILDARRNQLRFTRELISRIEKGISAGDSIENLAAQLARWARSATAASGGVITHTANELKRRSPGEVVGALRIVERTLAGSKPAL
jgi:hypothetical protein